MGSNVFANKQGISHKRSGAVASSTAPDVCKTPVGSSMVPIPYANNANPPRSKRAAKP